MDCGDWIAFGIIIVIAIQILYAITEIWEVQYGNVIGSLFVLIGVIKLGIDMGIFKNPVMW